MKETIGISPGVGILSVFRYIKYKSWYALAEYVDNAIDSYQKNRALLEATSPDYQLRIELELNQEGNFIRISDNAFGISSTDLQRALRMAVRPPDRTGLSEHGMGMKAASCWFCPKWSVETQALGDSVKRKVTFDVERIVSEGVETLEVEVLPSVPKAHFTNILLQGVYSLPTGRAVGKIRDHLTSIYRAFLRDKQVEIIVNGQALKYKAPTTLTAPPYSDKSAPPILWRKEVDFVCAGGQRVTGFAAIFATASTKEAGFALFRRGRVVEGSFDEGYRPAKIFVNTNSYYYQRIFGELHIDDFTASFTKDGIQWEDTEEDFLARLKEAIKAPGLDLLKQANGMRVREAAGGKDNDPPGGAPPPGGAGPAGGGSPGTSSGGNAQPGKGGTPAGGQPPGGGLFGGPSGNKPKPNETGKTNTRVLSAMLNGVSWRVYIELSSNPAHTDWLCISKLCIPADAQPGPNERLLGVRVSMAHPFTQQYDLLNNERLEPLLRLGAAIALAKTVASEGGAHSSGLLMDYINELLIKL
ncbi:hypothetical protein EJV47_23720 [Hymenobacter gummosus]|uniref:ATP-binding protein n=1 Tax=Hymenobacter gummosus TaxID=1776032 RepID=A0A431TWE2_9BACT|nr:ATP-binding protein [Hymenobacter gummosus]RTQ45841.1 hypothetical protein EJV47_23720 [Hymenobacter gummosus]